VVADKTGYPAEMLALDMDLEGDLGIDSIKRVEILSAVQDGAPGIPEVDPAHMGSLRTLGQIVDYMQGLLTGSPAAEVVAPAASAAPVAAVPVAALGRFTLEAVETPAWGLAQPTLWNGPIVITDDGAGVGAALVTELQARGIDATLVDVVPADAGGVVFLGGLRDFATDDDAIAVNREAFEAARTVAGAPGLFVTVQDTGGGFGLTTIEPRRAWSAGLAALAKTAAQEWGTAVKAIDLERGGRDAATLARAVATELLQGGPELEVGLDRNGVRRTLRSVSSEVEPTTPVIASGDVVVVSGGARGVTAASVIEWARRCKARFVLLGRTELSDEPACCVGITDDAALKRALLNDSGPIGPRELGAAVRRVLAGREIRSTLAAISDAGGEARYLSVDVTDGPGLAAALVPIRGEWGPIKGIVHGAGVLADKHIAHKTDDQFNRVFDTKVEGLRALLAATADDPLAVLCLFSSVAARCGNSGQVDYAMANEILNKVAHVERARRGDLLVKSLGWGPWEGGMVTPALSAHFAALGVPLIPLDVGAAMFADELQGGSPDQVELVLGGEPRAQALLSADSGRPTLRMALHLSHISHPHLESHSIGGNAVVPVILVIDWLCRMARAFRPDLELDSVNDVKVLRGIRLDGFHGRGDRVQLSCEELRNGDGALLAMEVCGADGRPLYRARISMVARSTPLSGAAPQVQLDDWGGAAIYDGDILFHGEAFQVIDAVDGISDAGASATLRGLSAASWASEPWQVDVAALDGALQLALLWAQRVLGGASLPTAIAQLRTSRGALPQGPIRCVLVGRESSRTRSLSDIALFDQNGTRFAELRGVETHARPSTSAPAVHA
jgi:acyl carrier protein